MTRERLPNRRINVTEPLRWQGYELELTVGFGVSGMVREVFVNNAKVGSEIEGMLQDACVVISILLQRHHPLVSLAQSIGRHGADDGPPTSLLGEIIDRMAAIEDTHKPDIARAYSQAAALRRRVQPQTDEVV